MNKRFVMGTLSAVLLAGTVPVCEAGAAEENSGSQVAGIFGIFGYINQEKTEEGGPTQAPSGTHGPQHD